VAGHFHKKEKARELHLARAKGTSSMKDLTINSRKINSQRTRDRLATISRLPGTWPLEMRAETAAAYCDEPSIDAFLAKVQRGVYSAPVREKGCLPKWHRSKLERDIARRHGLQFANSAITEDVTELI
jgi:hypothetical protein